MRGSPVPSTTPRVWMKPECLMPEANCHDPLRRWPPSWATAVPGRVPWPAMTGKRSPPKISSTAWSPR